MPHGVRSRVGAASVVARYPIAIRVGSVLVCLFLFFGIARGAVEPLPIVAALGAACLSIALVSYRAHIDMDEIQVRYWPFFTKRTQIKDVVAIAEERTLVFVTPTSRIPIWGLTAKAREHLSEMLPHRLRVSETPARTVGDPGAVVRRHVRRAVILAVAFLASLALSIPFLYGNPWHPYVEPIGRYIMFICLCLFLLALFQGGLAYVFWSYKRDMDKIDRTYGSE